MPRHTRKRRRKTAKKKRPVPTNKALYARVKAEAKGSLRYTLVLMQMAG